jgi:Putative auto-transporter adhesin, head GIN domain
LEVVCKGNGNLYATKLHAKKAKVICRGNGNAKVNVTGELEQIRSGNGNIQNVVQ